MTTVKVFSTVSFLVLIFSSGSHGMKATSISAGENGVNFTLSFGGVDRLTGHLGISLPAAIGAPIECDETNTCFQWGDYGILEISNSTQHDHCVRVEWQSNFARRLEDCFFFDSSSHWYGGGETFRQYWPIEQGMRPEAPFITGDSIQFPDSSYGGVTEYYWLVSTGVAIVVDENIPLFFSLNTPERPNQVCFIAKSEHPYQPRENLSLKYSLCVAEDIKEVHMKTLVPFFDKPTDKPDERMLIQPFWSTWAQYKEDVNQSIVIDYAERIISEGFELTSHVEIDDHWETCYGEAEFNLDKFPDPAGMVQQLKDMNLRVTLWVHPFINYGCDSFDTAFRNRFFVSDAKFKPSITWWWQGINSGTIDFSYPPAVTWWSNRLQSLQSTYGIDSFKFDAGEAIWLPHNALLIGDHELQPSSYSTKYVEAVATFGNLIEVRAARRNQNENIFVRMLDKDSVWGYDNGLKTLIPTLLHFGILGYPYTLPDMIGGNAYNGQMPSKEMFIRWMQANVFMPAVQFSIVPWQYDAETVQITKDVLALREQYKDEILKAANQSIVDGSPINRPLWWVDPTNPEAFTIDSEYLLGENILVAPVLEEGAVTRDIFLPSGDWRIGSDGPVYGGPGWLFNFSAPLNVVPFFTRVI